MRIRTIADFRLAVRNGPYAWPGGYPMYFVLADGEALAWHKCKDRHVRREMLMALRDGNAHGGDPSWRPVAVEVNWEDASLYCAHSGERIESAYAEDEANAGEV